MHFPYYYIEAPATRSQICDKAERRDDVNKIHARVYIVASKRSFGASFARALKTWAKLERRIRELSFVWLRCAFVRMVLTRSMCDLGELYALQRNTTLFQFL